MTQNLFFAFVYNALGVPIAGGVLDPLFGDAELARYDGHRDRGKDAEDGYDNHELDEREAGLAGL